MTISPGRGSMRSTSLDYVFGSREERGIVLRQDFRTEVHRRLAAAGTRVLDKDQIKLEPGQPQISVFPSLPRFNVGEGGVKRVVNSGCWTAIDWMGFSKGGSLLRRPASRHMRATRVPGARVTAPTIVRIWADG